MESPLFMCLFLFQLNGHLLNCWTNWVLRSRWSSASDDPDVTGWSYANCHIQCYQIVWSVAEPTESFANGCLGNMEYKHFVLPLVHNCRSFSQQHQLGATFSLKRFCEYDNQMFATSCPSFVLIIQPVDVSPPKISPPPFKHYGTFM